jgi:putative transcriptional regulator
MSNASTLRTREATKRERAPAPKSDEFGMTAARWKRLRAMTDDDVMAAAWAGPDTQPISKERLAGVRRVAFAKFTRQRLAMSQSAFARAFRIPLGTLRDWEQHRREPDQAARAYLDVIAREPEVVQRALKQAARDRKQPQGLPAGTPLRTTR